MSQEETRTGPHGHVFQKVPATSTLREHFITTAGDLVQVFPPADHVPHWMLIYRGDGMPGSHTEFAVTEVPAGTEEEHAFSVAEIWSGASGIRLARPVRSRLAYNHLWVWAEHPLFVPHWRSTSDNCVRIFPPGSLIGAGSIGDPMAGAWTIAVCDHPDQFPLHPERDVKTLTGEDAESRAFSVAEMYTRQKRT